MKIRMKIAVAGTFEGVAEGARPGDVFDVDEASGARYCKYHYAEPVVDLKEERAVAPKGEERAEPAKAAPKPTPAKPADKSA